MPALEQINNQEIDNQISVAELRDAIKPGGFLSDENNIKEVGKLLNNVELDENDKALLESLTTTIDNEINTILERLTVTEEDIMLINVRKELLGENDSRVQRLEELTTQQNNEENPNTIEEIPQNTEGPTKEEIIMQKFNELLEQNRNDIKNNLNFTGDIINDIDGLLETGNVDLTKIDNIKAINLINNIIKNDIERHNKLGDIVNEKIMEMSKAVNARIAGNKGGNKDYYKQNERMLVQLRANVCYGEELELNGERGSNIRDVGETNEGKTNIYIYHLELKTRKDVTDIRAQFNQLLNIPNLDAKFIGVSQEAKDSIMREFLQFFLKIRVHGMFFENKIGTSDLESVLTNLINAEKYKGMSVDRYLEIGESNELPPEVQEMRKKIRELLSGFVTIGQYFKNSAEESINNLLSQDAANVEYNRQLYEVNEIRKLRLKIQELYTLNSNTEISESEKREQIKKLGEEILNNPHLGENQRNDILMILGINFSDIPDESSFHEITTDEIMNQWNNWKKIRFVDGEIINIGKGGLHRGEAYGNGGQRLPDKILYTDGCNITFDYYVETEYNMGSPERVNRMNILVDGSPILLDREGVPYLNGYSININYKNELIITKGGNGSDLRRTFGDEICNEYQIARNEYNERNRENEEVNDIMTQINSENILGLSEISEESKQIINDETGYTKELEDYNKAIQGMRYANTPYAQAPTFQGKAPQYTEYRELNIPGSEKLIVHIEPSQLNTINEAIQKYGERICFIPTKKTEKRIYELTITDLKITEEDEQGNINIYEIDNEMRQGNKLREISGEEINEANHINNIIMATIGNTPGLEDALNKAKNIDEDMKWMQNIYKKFERGEGSENEDGTRGISDDDIDSLRIKATETAEYLNDICKFHNKFVQMKNGLERRYQGESNISTENEEKIKNLISCLDYLVNATIQGGELYEYCQSMLNAKNVHSNDTRLERVGRRFKNNGLKIIGAIAGGVLAVILVPVTGGSSLAILAKMAMIMTAGGMIAGGASQWANERLRSKYYAGGIEIDGKKIEVRYDDPTSLELALKGNISRGDYATQLAMNFIIGSATTFGCMAAGQLIGGWITKACESGRMSSGFKSFLNRFNKNFKVENGDPMTDGIFKQMAAKIGQNPKSMLNNFNERFFKEFKEEILEEIGETGFDEAANAAKGVNGGNTGLSMILSGFGLLATAWHCITPGGNMTKIYRENGISLGDIKFGNLNTLEITLDYSGDYQTIIDYYHENGFDPVDGHLEMQNPENPEITNIIYLKKTEAPLETRTLANQLGLYGIQIDTETGKGYYENLAKIQELELSGQVNVTIDPTTKKVTIISGETTLELEQKNEIGFNETTNINIEQISPLVSKINNTVFESVINPEDRVVESGHVDPKDIDQQTEFDINKSKENITKLGEKISSLEKQIKEKENEISKLNEGDPHKEELEGEIKDLNDQLKKSKKRKESLETAIDTVEQWNSQYDPEVLQGQIDSKKEILSTMDKTSKEYKELKKEIENLERKKESGIHETLVNGEKLIEKVSIKERLMLRLKELNCKLKELYYNITNNTTKIEETKIEIKNIEKEIHLMNNEIAKIIENTYQGLRNLKGLSDTELRELTRTYYEKILKPIKFTLINPSQTFESDIVNNEFQTQREISIEGKFEENPSKFSGVREKITEIRLGNYSTFKSMSDIDTFIEENFGECPTEKQILQNLKKSLEENIGLEDKRMLEEERAVIFLNSVSYMLDFNEAYPDSSPNNVYNILDTNQNKLIHQHIQDKHYLTGSSHDVLHILRGNMNMAENYMGNMSAKERVITRQIIIDHDMGYTSVFNKFLSSIRSDVFFDATKDHPLRSSQFIEDNEQRYIDNFGYDEYIIIKNSVTGHSKPDTVNLPTKTEANISDKTRNKQINAVISVVDCVAASADYKSAFLFSQSQIAGEFLSVYIDMNDGNIENAIDGLHKIIETANTIEDPNLKGAIFDALNSLHLTDPATGEITLDKKIENIDGMSDNEINKAKDKLINKLHDPDKAGKTLSIFCKANGISDPSIVTDDNITPEQVKNYLKFDYINDRVGFPYEKYLSQYGVRVSVDNEGKTIIGENGGVVTATFELAGDSFETLINIGKNNYDFKGKTIADFALASFLKVCEDMNIEIKGKDINPQIKELKEYVNNRSENHNNQTISQYLEEKFGKELVITGKNGEKITLKFDGKSYEGFNNIVTEIFKINNELDKSIDILKNNPETWQSQLIDIQNELIELGRRLTENSGINIDSESWNMIVNNLTSLQDNGIEKAIENINSLRKYYRFIMEDF